MYRAYHTPHSLCNIQCSVYHHANHPFFTQLNRLRNVIFFLFLMRWTRKVLLKLKGRGLFGSFADAYIAIRRTLYGYFLRAPGVRSQVQKQVSEAITKLQAKLVP